MAQLGKPAKSHAPQMQTPEYGHFHLAYGHHMLCQLLIVYCTSVESECLANVSGYNSKLASRSVTCCDIWVVLLTYAERCAGAVKYRWQLLAQQHQGTLCAPPQANLGLQVAP